MIFILEGLDKVGKSTLAKKLCKMHHARLIKVNAPKTKYPFYEYISLINELNVSKNYVLDRFYLGELAYGPVYRKKSGLSREQHFYIEQLLLKFNALLVYCWLDNNELAYNFYKDKEEFTRIEDAPKIDKLFREAYKQSILPKMFFNYKKNKPADLKISSSSMLKLNLSYLGKHKPEVLFVGDEPNYRLHLVKNVPYSVFNSVSGMFLMKTLLNVNFSFGLVNSKEGERLLSCKDLKLIGCNKIICLGKKASSRISNVMCRPRTINHPQHAKRFYGKDAENRYLKEIMEAVNDG